MWPVHVVDWEGRDIFFPLSSSHDSPPVSLFEKLPILMNQKDISLAIVRNKNHDSIVHPANSSALSLLIFPTLDQRSKPQSKLFMFLPQVGYLLPRDCMICDKDRLRSI